MYVIRNAKQNIVAYFLLCLQLTQELCSAISYNKLHFSLSSINGPSPIPHDIT